MGKTRVWRCTCCVQATSGLPENFDRMFVRPLGVPFHARNITTREGRGAPPRKKYISAKSSRCRVIHRRYQDISHSPKSWLTVI
jgi:hypothetical protein